MKGFFVILFIFSDVLVSAKTIGGTYNTSGITSFCTAADRIIDQLINERKQKAVGSFKEQFSFSWSFWSHWTSCTSKVQNRTRVIPVCEDKLCNYTEDYETRKCEEKEQFSWSFWSHWTSCTSNLQNRTRVIPVCEDKLCNYTEDYETRKCEEKEQLSWSFWSHWTSCTSNLQNRTRVIPVCEDKLCNYTEDYETRKCEEKEQFSWSSWSHWTSCTLKLQNRTRVIPVCGDKLCNYTEDYETRKCEEKGSSVPQKRPGLISSIYLCVWNKRRCLLKGYEINSNVRLNRSSLHKDLYISSDNLMISNVQTPDTTQSRGIGFKQYRGVMVDICVEPDEVITFEVQYEFHITTTLTRNELMFEIGVAEVDKIDNHFYVGHSKVGGFSFFVYKIDNYTGLAAEHDYHFDIIFSQFSNITKGTTKNGTLFFSIDRLTFDTFSIFNHQEVLYSFKNIASAVPLCPVFGVRNTHVVNAKLRLKHTTYMKLLK